jgi:hypothetical protein
LFDAEGRRGIKKTIALRNFVKAPKNYKYNLQFCVLCIATSTTEAVEILYWLHNVPFQISSRTRTFLTGSFWLPLDVPGKRCNCTENQIISVSFHTLASSPFTFILSFVPYSLCQRRNVNPLTPNDLQRQRTF